jgi:hypothetical protein
MKTFRVLFIFVLFAATCYAQSGQQSFARLRSLSGSWAGKNAEGMPVKVVFRETAGGSALMSEIQGHGPENMISMFHLDNGRLMMTHYCGAGNQPRMVAAASPDGKVFTFNFVDGTNIATPDAGHMQKLVITVADADHHIEDWTFVDHGKEQKEVFTLQRAQ